MFSDGLNSSNWNVYTWRVPGGR